MVKSVKKSLWTNLTPKTQRHPHQRYVEMTTFEWLSKFVVPKWHFYKDNFLLFLSFLIIIHAKGENIVLWPFLNIPIWSKAIFSMLTLNLIIQYFLNCRNFQPLTNFRKLSRAVRYFFPRMNSPDMFFVVLHFKNSTFMSWTWKTRANVND